MVRVVDELVTLGVLAEEQGRWRLVEAARRYRPRRSREPPTADRQAGRSPGARGATPARSGERARQRVHRAGRSRSVSTRTCPRSRSAASRWRGRGSSWPRFAAVRPARRDGGRALPLHPQPLPARPGRAGHARSPPASPPTARRMARADLRRARRRDREVRWRAFRGGARLPACDHASAARRRRRRPALGLPGGHRRD